ncbi:MAG: dipeptide epimerase [Candidatus Eremiobacter antarcticus]|nr:dipeptide epimerase [Candidatus Eremiobacteraeota bacterium]MBC5808235.1 dipeptide epimerase [Candidatus Eremiobacteraeota bacterium]PZR63620.1 MAG: dipeptide epimerase [Candidatus Eremiobacter sp. RRmetagenome_bin22]
MATAPVVPTAAVLSHETLELHLRHTFTISRSSEDVAKTLLLRLEVGGITAYGESSPVGRYEETVEQVARQIDAMHLGDADFWFFDEIIERLPRDARAARCGIDLVLHDLAGKRLGVPVYRLLGLDPGCAALTSFTIGIADLPQTIEKTREARDLPVLKVKLGSGKEVETLEAIRSIYTGTVRLDANEGWNAEQAAKILAELGRFDIEFCEQPIPAGHPEQLRFVRERSPVPIVADEDCRTLDDVALLAGCVDGINIKLVKCGGMREAVRMIHAARALGMKVMIGCMIESSVLCTAAAQLTPLVDYADLDGPLLITDDPFVGVSYDAGRLRLPPLAGLGVMPRTLR